MNSELNLGAAIERTARGFVPVSNLDGPATCLAEIQTNSPALPPPAPTLASAKRPRQQLAFAVVLGFGDPIRSDHGVGIRALRRLEGAASLPPRVRFVHGGTRAAELVGSAAGAARLVVLAAVDVSATPGTLIHMWGEFLESLPAAGSTNDPDLAELLTALRHMGQPPREYEIWGVQPATTAPGLSLSPAVEAALPDLVAAVVDGLNR